MWDESAAASGSQGVFPRFVPSPRGYRVHALFLFFMQPVCLAASFQNKFWHKKEGWKKHLRAAQKKT